MTLSRVTATRLRSVTTIVTGQQSQYHNTPRWGTLLLLNEEILKILLSTSKQFLWFHLKSCLCHVHRSGNYVICLHPTLAWICGCLKSHSQKISCDNHTACCCGMACGLPQHSSYCLQTRFNKSAFTEIVQQRTSPGRPGTYVTPCIISEGSKQ